MDQSQNFIRSPDESKREILINDSKSNEELELESTILQSLQEEEEYYNVQLNTLMNQIKCRREMFKNIEFTIKRVGAFDKNILEIYGLIEYVIDSYCSGNIENYKYDKITYDKIFNTLLKIRLSESEINLLKSIILIDV
jgi:hypothetical protein